MTLKGSDVIAKSKNKRYPRPARGDIFAVELTAAKHFAQLVCISANAHDAMFGLSGFSDSNECCLCSEDFIDVLVTGNECVRSGAWPRVGELHDPRVWPSHIPFGEKNVFLDGTVYFYEIRYSDNLERLTRRIISEDDWRHLVFRYGQKNENLLISLITERFFEINPDKKLVEHEEFSVGAPVYSLSFFEGDDAFDFIQTITRSKSLAFARKAFTTALKRREYLESPQGVEAIIAAEVLAAASGLPSSDFLAQDELVLWLDRLKPDIDLSLITMSLEVLPLVLGRKSELAASWIDPYDEKNWRNSVFALQQRLISLVAAQQPTT
jgi:hypothetical protein